MKHITTCILGITCLFAVTQISHARSLEQAVNEVYLQITSAQTLGDQSLVNELFSVLFELFLVADTDNNDNDNDSRSSYDDDDNFFNNFFGNNNRNSRNSNRDADVSTLSAQDVDEEEATLRGRVEEGDDVEVWFAIDNNDRTPSCTSSAQRERPSRDEYDEDDVFELDVYRLDEDDTYYYRACGEDRDGYVVSGNIRSFTTDDDNRRSSNSNDSRAQIDTLSANRIDDEEATLRGRVEEGDDVEVWFAIDDSTDRTPSCTSSAQREDLSRDEYDEGDSFQLTVEDLEDNEKHYYRACGEGTDGRIASGSIRSFTTDDDNRSNNDDEPDVETDTIRNITDDSATLRGSVDMNDFDNGRVFFVWGEDEELVEDVADDFDTYRSVEEDGDDLQKEQVDSDLDDDDDYSLKVTRLDDDTDYFVSLCVEYEDDDRDDVLECGSVEEFTTD